MKTERIGGLRARGRAEDKDEEGQFSGRKEHARRVCTRARAITVPAVSVGNYGGAFPWSRAAAATE